METRADYPVAPCTRMAGRLETRFGGSCGGTPGEATIALRRGLNRRPTVSSLASISPKRRCCKRAVEDFVVGFLT